MAGGLQQVVADDFSLGDGSGIWLIDGFKFWGYQPDATSPSIDLVAVAILDRAPYLPGMQVLWATTGVPNVSMTNIYRVLDTDMGDTTRQIQLIEFAINPIVLPGGEYWLAWSTGSIGPGGTWVPAVTVLDVDYPGNGLQIINTTNVTPLLDAGTYTQKGVPFQITGSAVPEPALMAQVLFGGGLGMLAFLRRGRKRN